MAKRKSYLIDDSDESAVVSIADRIKPPNTIRLDGSVHAIMRNLDIGKLYGSGCDDVLSHLHQALWDLHNSGTRTLSSIEGYYTKGIVPFVDYLYEKSQSIGRDIAIADINLDLMNDYVHNLATTRSKNGVEIISFATQRSRFSHIRTLLIHLSSQGILPTRHKLIPANPYPNISRRTKGEKALSDSERRAFYKALLDELEAIRNNSSNLLMPERLTVYLLLIAAATGRNTTPLLQISRGAMRPHPIKEDRHLLVTQKLRGGRTHIQSFDSDQNEIITIKNGVYELFNEVLAMTDNFMKIAPRSIRDYLWLYESNGLCDGAGTVVTLNQQSLCRHSAAIVKRHKLLHDDGKPMKLTVGSLRKTFVNKIWKLSGGDPLITARLAGHSVSVSDSHYLAVTPEMERNHKFCGIALVESLQGKSVLPGQKTISIVPTGVSHCSDPKNGKYAPKNGDYCTDFLSCFRCPNQIITGDDLYRLFSFYWLLIKERGFLGANRWGRIYAWVIRDIDNVISTKFPADIVSDARCRAKNNPHPMWRDRSILTGDA